MTLTVEGHKHADFDLLDPARAEQEYRQLLEEQSLGMTFLHFTTEYARHNGHADLLREHLDGVAGA
ncbi:DUF664 domain-containing protein [Kitasatospora sp. NPDC004614]|uniref:mycothiol transferase n=1 Tax=unclassified Kitasatospora TaxID=2633591 RepID=UPI00367A3200